MTAPDPGRVLGRALLGWGLGHLALGQATIGWSLLAMEVVAALIVAWLTIGLASSSAYLVPFLAGVAFIVAWAWQAVAAYRSARARQPEHSGAPERSPAAAIGWLSLPLLAWGTGFWLIGADAATPAATLDRFVTAWSDGALESDAWPPSVVDAAADADRALGSAQDRLRDVRFTIVEASEGRATAVAEAIHYERRPSSFLWVFRGSELYPVADERLLSLDLAAVPVQLPGGGDIGAVRWELVDAANR
ncbi:MAG TPA: hypothetical protein VLA59_01880 [Patescibacteria group bacterium]|nr:hypothetical protein [Patescibacteria group bacterium]